METDGRTIIISTPEELFPLITEAVRLAGFGFEYTRNSSVRSNQKLLAPKDVERVFGIRQRLSPTGVRKVLARHIRALADVFSMNALYWKSILPLDVSKLRNQNDGFLRLPAYPL